MWPKAATCNLRTARRRRARTSAQSPKGVRRQFTQRKAGSLLSRELSGLCDLVRLKAARADIGTQLAAVLLDPHLLQVRIEAPLGGDHRVASGLAERRSLTAAVAYLGHRALDGNWSGVGTTRSA